jgi:hypothetical protein
MRTAPKMRFPICSVCNGPVELEISKTDDQGKAVHEECYVVKVTAKEKTLKRKYLPPREK